MTNTNTTTLAQVQLSQVTEQLKDMSDSSLQICHNNYCIETGYEDIIYENDEYNINEQFDTPFDVLRNIQSYNLSDNYFYFHNGNLVSFNYLTGDDSPITFSELAQWIVDNELYNVFDIEVTTLDDMLASIEDNINDDENMLSKLVCLLGLSVMLDDDYKISESLGTIKDYSYNDLYYIINYLGINYQ